MRRPNPRLQQDDQQNDDENQDEQSTADVHLVPPLLVECATAGVTHGYRTRLAMLRNSMRYADGDAFVTGSDRYARRFFISLNLSRSGTEGPFAQRASVVAHAGRHFEIAVDSLRSARAVPGLQR